MVDFLSVSRDDEPQKSSLTRRELLVGGALLAGGGSLSPEASAQALNAAAPTAKFMEVSSLLINHPLDAEVGTRMALAMARANPALDAEIGSILEIAKKRNAAIVEDFFGDIPLGRLKETALAIISAWYTGVIDQSANAEVFAFEQALMYQPTRDVMTISSYAISGPNGWNANAPALEDMPKF